MTGLSGAGKSTLATLLKRGLEEKGIPAEVLDAEVYRQTINNDLGFSLADRKENIKRLGLMANEICQKGVVAIIAAINPFEETRNDLKRKYNARTIWIRCDLTTLIHRDTKGLYKRALLPNDDPQKIMNLSGVNDPFDTPLSADLIVDTSLNDEEISRQQLLRYVLTQLTLSSCQLV